MERKISNLAFIFHKRGIPWRGLGEVSGIRLGNVGGRLNHHLWEYTVAPSHNGVGGRWRSPIITERYNLRSAKFIKRRLSRPRNGWLMTVKRNGELSLFSVVFSPSAVWAQRTYRNQLGEDTITGLGGVVEWWSLTPVAVSTTRTQTLGARVPGTRDYMLRTLRALVKRTHHLLINNRLGTFRMYPQHGFDLEPSVIFL